MPDLARYRFRYRSIAKYGYFRRFCVHWLLVAENLIRIKWSDIFFRRQLLRWWYLEQQRVRVRVMIGVLFRGRVRIKIRLGVTFNVSIYHRSNCRRSKCRTFPHNHSGDLDIFSRIFFIFTIHVTTQLPLKHTPSTLFDFLAELDHATMELPPRTGASIHFSDGGGGGQKYGKCQNCSVRSARKSVISNFAREARRKIENCVCLIVFFVKFYSFVLPESAF